jgi:hypothetical protein
LIVFCGWAKFPLLLTAAPFFCMHWTLSTVLHTVKLSDNYTVNCKLYRNFDTITVCSKLLHCTWNDANCSRDHVTVIGCRGVKGRGDKGEPLRQHQQVFYVSFRIRYSEWTFLWDSKISPSLYLSLSLTHTQAYTYILAHTYTHKGARANTEAATCTTHNTHIRQVPSAPLLLPSHTSLPAQHTSQNTQHTQHSNTDAISHIPKRNPSSPAALDHTATGWTCVQVLYW